MRIRTVVALGLAAMLVGGWDPRVGECASKRCFCVEDPTGGPTLAPYIMRSRDQAELVFEGTVERVTATDTTPRMAGFRVTAWWKGQGVGDNISIALSPGPFSFTDCDLPMNVGERWIVFASSRPRKDGRLGTTKCTGSRLRAGADTVIGVLKEAKRSGGTDRLDANLIWRFIRTLQNDGR